MNCEQVNRILDGEAAESLSAIQTQVLEQHLAECGACRESWAAYDEIAAMAVPDTPLDLSRRVEVAVAEYRAEAARRPRQSVLVGSVAIVGLAVAAAAAIQLGRHVPQSAPKTEEAPDEAGRVTEVSALTPGDPGLGSIPAGSARIDATAANQPGSNGSDQVAERLSLDPYSIVVLSALQVQSARPHPDIDAQRAEELNICYQAILQQLRAIDGLNVIGDDRVAPYVGSDLSNEEIARQLGAGSFLVVSPDNWCRAWQFDTTTGATRSGLMSGSLGPRADGWQSFATQVAAGVRDATLRDRAAVLAETRAAVLDTSLGDGERMSALFELYRHTLGRGSAPDTRDEAVVAAAVQIGMTSTDPRARLGAWLGLRGVDDHYVLQPLLHALANDPDEGVRIQAALALPTFLGEPGVKEALQRAAAEDPSQHPREVCCVATVREAAHRASLTDEELVEWARETILDETLPTRDRLVPLVITPDNRSVDVDALGDAATIAVFDMVVHGSGDASIRSMALNALARTRAADGSVPANAELVSLLLDTLANDEGEYVRATAARTLQPYAAQPDVRAALERALTDPSTEVRLAAQGALAGNGW